MTRHVITFSMASLFVGMLVSCSNNQILTQPNHGQMLDIDTPTLAMTDKQHSSALNQQVAMSNLNLDNQGNQITVKPSKTVHATAQYVYACKTCATDSTHQIIVGLAGRSAQACIYNGGTEGQGSADFMLKVPAKPGKYQIRFRPLQAADCAGALQQGWDDESSPPKENTIGTIIVSRKATDDNASTMPS